MSAEQNEGVIVAQVVRTNMNSHSSECMENGLATSVHIQLDEYLVCIAEKH